jgi:hypothetical protein
VIIIMGARMPLPFPKVTIGDIMNRHLEAVVSIAQTLLRYEYPEVDLGVQPATGNITNFVDQAVRLLNSGAADILVSQREALPDEALTVRCTTMTRDEFFAWLAQRQIQQLTTRAAIKAEMVLRLATAEAGTVWIEDED